MSTTEAPQSQKHAVIGDLESEIATTRRVLERVPEQHFTWKPHPRSFSLGELATHVANLFGWGADILTGEEMDIADAPRRGAVRGREELLALLERTSGALRQALAAADGATLARPWTLKNGGQVMLSRPRGELVRGMVINHIIHHRGQLTVYLRLLDVPVPPVYGPTADEQLS